jgi:hypothetical protein
MAHQQKQYEEDDDGRVICNMDVEGMRWHSKPVRHPWLKEPESTPPSSHEEPITDREARRFTWYAVLAGLLIVAVFSAVWVLLVLFMTKVWFA